jgi:hypothetical protein
MVIAAVKPVTNAPPGYGTCVRRIAIGVTACIV